LKIMGVGAALRAPFEAAEGIFASAGTEMARMSQRTGASVEALSQLGYAAKQSGVDMDGLGNGLKKMQKSIGEAEQGSGEATQAFARLGLSVAQLKNLSPDQQFEAIAQQISRISDPAMRATMAMQIFGRNGASLLPLLNQGASGIEAMRKEADRLGLTMSGDDANAAVTFTKTLSTLWDVVKMGAFNIGAALAPVLQRLATNVTEVAATVTRWIKEHREAIVVAGRVATGVLVAGAAIYALGVAFGVVAGIIGGVVTVISAVVSVVGFLISPLGLVIAAVSGAVYAFVRFTAAGQSMWNTLKSTLGTMFQTFKDTFAGIYDAIAGGNLGLAASIAIKGVQVAMLTGVSALSDSVGGEFGGFIGELGSKLAAGDLGGAWTTMLNGLYAAWASFSKAIIDVAAYVAKAIISKWEQIDGAIGNTIQHIIENGGVLGKLLGGKYDAEYQKQMERNMEAQRNRTKQQNIDMLPEDERRKIMANMTAAERAKLGERTTDRNPQQDADAAKSQASDVIKGMGDKMNAGIDAWKATADKAAEHAKAALAPGNQHSHTDLDKARSEFADLLKQAKLGHDVAIKAAKEHLTDTQKNFDATMGRSSAAGTFNGVAATRALGGGHMQLLSVNKQMLGHLRSIDRQFQIQEQPKF
jgi:hypothetical protein